MSDDFERALDRITRPARPLLPLPPYVDMFPRCPDGWACGLLDESCDSCPIAAVPAEWLEDGAS